MKVKPSIVFLGATGAVGGETLKSLLNDNQFEKITLLGRRQVEDISLPNVYQAQVDIFKPETYKDYIKNNDTAICTLGVGEPSKMSREEFERIDKQAVIDFAKQCKADGVNHFILLNSIGSNPKSNNYYLNVKGELIEALKEMKFTQLSIFQPSMILTPTNRYGFSQGLVLKVWPVISPLLIGGLKKYRGIKVADLGSAIAKSATTETTGLHYYTWTDFKRLNAS